MKCSEIKDLLSAFYDNELSPDLRASVDAHVGQCAECKNELAQFKSLSSIAAGLKQPETPAPVWSAVEQSLDEQRQGLDERFFREGEAPAEPALETAQRELRPPNQRLRPPGHTLRPPSRRHSGKRFLQAATAIAATLIVGFVGFEMWHYFGDHDHKEMAEAMQKVASEIDSDGITTLLLEKFGGSEISFQDAITQVGYRPVASKGLPPGYSVESIQVLDMPCCKCTQTACQRPDKTRFFIYEHDNEETGWFEHQNKRMSECCGKTCEIVELDDQLAVTWQKDNRHVTLLGVRDEEEVELLVSLFEENS